MALGRLWAGRAFGTNTGNIFVQLSGEDNALSGTIHFNDTDVGAVVYSVVGSFDGSLVILSGAPSAYPQGAQVSRLKASASLTAHGELRGQWNTEIGTAGTFVLYPHDLPQSAEAGMRGTREQIHVARHEFTAIGINKDQLVQIAKEMQNEFEVGRLVVTAEGNTARTCLLADFEQLSFGEERAKIVKLYVQERVGDLNRTATLEFGPVANFALTQGPDRAWVLGMLEQLKGYVRPYERSYSTNIKRLGLGINQLMLVGALVFLPDLETVQDRATLIGIVVFLAFLVTKAHARYLPFTTIYLRGKTATAWQRIAPSVISWIIAATASVVASLTAAYLMGWIGLL